MLAADKRVLSDIRLAHGPCGLLARYFAFADAFARARGILLRVRTDFYGLLALIQKEADNWSPLSPMFNPYCCNLSAANAFWIEGVDETGDPVVVNAGRLYDHGGRSVADDLRTLEVFYDDPEPYVAAGERVTISAPSAQNICGRVTFAGAMWVRPDYRRMGFSKIVPRLTRGYALTQWNTPAFWAGIEPDLDEKGVTRAYGSWHVEEGFTLHMPGWRGDLEFLFLSMGQVTLVRDLAETLAHSATDTSRRSDNPITNKSPFLHQGMRMRS